MPHESEKKPSVIDWRWKLRLFVSADLVGSTAYKSMSDGASPKWAVTFKEFFRDFPTAVERAYSGLDPKCPQCENHLRPWKFSGDEILFWVELTDSCQAVSHLLAFKNAVKSFPDLWAEKKLPLRLKATAWLAGFPVTNTEISIAIDGNGTKSLDFIGPSIDLGFRIAKFSDVRRLVLSPDLALMVLDSIEALELSRAACHIHLHGREILKGVIGGEPFPILWLDMNDGMSDPEERLLGIRRDFRSDDMKDFLRSFIDRTPRLRRPFIHGDPNPRYCDIDPELEKLRDAMAEEATERNYLIEGEAPDAAGEPRTPKDPVPPKPGDLTLGSF